MGIELGYSNSILICGYYSILTYGILHASAVVKTQERAFCTERLQFSDKVKKSGLSTQDIVQRNCCCCFFKKDYSVNRNLARYSDCLVANNTKSSITISSSND